ncbi:MAG: PIN domain-containing protein, partial [Thermoplasmata archaeon]
LEDTLPPHAERAFEEAEAGRGHLFLPQIALGEFVYIALRGRLKGDHAATRVREVIHNLSASGAFTLSSMSPEAWEAFLNIRISELHDRMIAAEAIGRRVPLISNDSSFDGIEGLRVVW